MIAALLGKFKGWLAVAGAVVLAVGYSFLRGRSEGKQAAKVDQYKTNQKVQEKWDAVDRQRPDFDAAVDSLRQRSER